MLATVSTQSTKTIHLATFKLILVYNVENSLIYITFRTLKQT